MSQAQCKPEIADMRAKITDQNLFPPKINVVARAYVRTARYAPDGSSIYLIKYFTYLMVRFFYVSFIC